MKKAVALLGTLPSRQFDMTTTRTGPTVSIAMTTKGVDYIDVFVDRRSYPSQDVVNDAVTFGVTAPAGSVIDLRGYRGTGELVCARRTTLA